MPSRRVWWTLRGPTGGISRRLAYSTSRHCIVSLRPRTSPTRAWRSSPLRTPPGRHSWSTAASDSPSELPLPFRVGRRTQPSCYRDEVARRTSWRLIGPKPDCAQLPLEVDAGDGNHRQQAGGQHVVSGEDAEHRRACAGADGLADGRAGRQLHGWGGKLDVAAEAACECLVQ